MTIKEFIDEYGLKLVICRMGEYWQAHIEEVEEKDGISLKSLYSTGKTPKEVLKSFCERISNITIVYRQSSPYREEIETDKIVSGIKYKGSKYWTYKTNEEIFPELANVDLTKTYIDVCEKFIEMQKRTAAKIDFTIKEVKGGAFISKDSLQKICENHKIMVEIYKNIFNIRK